MVHVFAADQLQSVIEARVVGFDRVIIALPKLVIIHHMDCRVELLFLANLGQLLLKRFEIVKRRVGQGSGRDQLKRNFVVFVQCRR